MKIKKLLIVTISLVLLSIILSCVASYSIVKTPLLIASTVGRYKALNTLNYFFTYLPPIFLTSFLVGLSLDFGGNDGKCKRRFSSGIITRYKYVLVISLIFTLIVSLTQEVFLPYINTKLTQYAQYPALKQNYKELSQYLFDNGQYKLSYKAAVKAHAIDANDRDTLFLIDQADEALTHQGSNMDSNNSINRTKSKESKGGKSVPQKLIEKNTEKIGDNTPPLVHKDVSVMQGESYTLYELLTLARNNYKEKDYFNAHYYAELAMKNTNERDINYRELRTISAEAWNKIEEIRVKERTEANKVFERKVEGYNALLENDNVKAYYIFHALYLEEKGRVKDPDIVFYHSLAEERLKNACFFTDETLNLSYFESNTDIYFSINNLDRSRDIYYINGITEAVEGSTLIQYLRGFCTVHLDFEGNYKSGVYYPYAKMTNLDTSLFSTEERMRLRIPEKVKFVPYILLHSIDKDTNSFVHKGQVIKGEEGTTGEGYLVLPLDFEHLSLIKDASEGAASMKLPSLYSFINIASNYGYSKNVFLQTLLNRLLFPIFFLIIMIAVAILAWQGRLGQGGHLALFKFKWIVVFPIFYLFFLCMYELTLAIYKLLNYSLLNSFNMPYSLIVGAFFYFLVFIGVTVMFLACHETQDE